MYCWLPHLSNLKLQSHSNVFITNNMQRHWILIDVAASIVASDIKEYALHGPIALATGLHNAKYIALWLLRLHLWKPYVTPW